MSNVRRSLALPTVLGLLATTIALVGCGSGTSSNSSSNLPNIFTRTNLVSDIAGYTDSAGAAAVTDPNLKNPWGVSFSPSGPFWVSDNSTGLATVYNGTGTIVPLVVNIPTPTASTGGAVTGQVYNPTTDFNIAANMPAKFIFTTEDGTISAWAGGSNATLEVDLSASGNVYKGLAMASTSGGNFLYATDFHGSKIDVFDKNFALTNLSGTFTDPNTPVGFAPYNIANIGGSLYVVYAKQDSMKHDDVGGTGLGFISIFSSDGRFIRRFATGSGAGGGVHELNAPWGITLAPPDFGRFSNALLVGNFEDGHITAFDPTLGRVLGQLQDSNGNAIAIPGLWTVTFGNNGSAGQSNVLYFTAGINGESDGLFGSIQPATRKASKRTGK